MFTVSSGNFAAAFAFSASLIGLEPLVVVPKNASAIKVQSLLRNGGKMIEAGTTLEERMQKQEEMMKSGRIFISSLEV